MMGISKRELLADYYPDELAAVLKAWSDIHGCSKTQDTEPVSVHTFLDM